MAENMNQQSIEFMKKLRSLYMKDKHSDCTIQVVEKNTTIIKSGKSRKRNHNKISDGKLEEIVVYSVPAHSFVLASQSQYFDKLFAWPNEEGSNIFKIKMEKNESDYALKFIECFYRHDMFKDLSFSTTLCLLELADRFSCESIMKQASEYLPMLKIKDLDECDFLAARTANVEYGLKAMEDSVAKLLKLSKNYVSKMFCPLEKTYEIYKLEFHKLSLEFILLILKDPYCKLCYHENSLFYYVLKWFEFDKSRQKSLNIELILQEISYKDLTASFLVDVLTIDHPILSKYSGFKKWYIFVLSRLATHSNRPCPFDKSTELSYERNFKEKDGIYLKKFRLTKANDLPYFVIQKIFIYKGFEISPGIVCDKINDNSSNNQLWIKFMFFNVPEYTVKDKEYFEITKFSFAVICKRSCMQSIENHKMEFGNATKENSASGDFVYSMEKGLEGDSYYLGDIADIWIKDCHSIDICLAIKEDGVKWPKSFPKHLTNNNYEVNLKLE